MMDVFGWARYPVRTWANAASLTHPYLGNDLHQQNKEEEEEDDDDDDDDDDA